MNQTFSPTPPSSTPPSPTPGAQTAEIQVDVRSYFPTPMAVVELPDGPVLNKALREAVMARVGEGPGVSHSNLGGWQSSWDLTEWAGREGMQILEAAQAVATRLTCGREGEAVKVDWKINSWANVNQSGHGNEFHTHPGAYWSGSYYVDDGGVFDNPALGGEFELQDPRGVAPAMYAPLLAINVPGGQSVGASELVRPKAGMMIIFPSWLSHGVRPYTGNGTRISIAFNLSV